MAALVLAAVALLQALLASILAPPALVLAGIAIYWKHWLHWYAFPAHVYYL